MNHNSGVDKGVGVATKSDHPKNQSHFFQTMMGQYCLDKKAPTSFQIPFENLLEFSTDWLNALLTDWLMPSDYHDSITANPTSLIFSLFDITSAWDVPFGILQYIQYILHGLTSVLHLSLLTAKSVNLVVACDGFLACAIEIAYIFHSGYLDYRGAFQLGLNLYCCVTSWKNSTKKRNGYFTFQTIIDGRGTFNWATRHHSYFS